VKKIVPALVLYLVGFGVVLGRTEGGKQATTTAVGVKGAEPAARFGLKPLKQIKLFARESSDPAAAKLPPKRGYVDWFNGYVVAEGRGFPCPIEMKQPDVIGGQEKAMASRAAQADALRNVLALLNGISLNGKVTVGARAFKKGTIELKGFIRGHQWSSESWHKVGGIQYSKVVVKVPLWGVSSVCAKVYDEERKRFSHMRFRPSGASSRAGRAFAPDDYVFIDARGTRHKPALYPVIADKRGRPVYCIAHLDKTVCVTRCMVRYAFVDDDADEPWSGGGKLSPDLLSRILGLRAAEAAQGDDKRKRRRKRLKPKLVVRASKSNGGKLILDKKAAKKLADDPETRRLLGAGRVIVIMDSRVAGIEGALPVTSSTMLARK